MADLALTEAEERQNRENYETAKKAAEEAVLEKLKGLIDVNNSNSVGLKKECDEKQRYGSIEFSYNETVVQQADPSDSSHGGQYISGGAPINTSEERSGHTSLSLEQIAGLMKYAAQKNQVAIDSIISTLSTKDLVAITEHLKYPASVAFGPNIDKKNVDIILPKISTAIESRFSENYANVLTISDAVGKLKNESPAKATLEKYVADHKTTINSAQKAKSFITSLDVLEEKLKKLQKEYTGQEKGRFFWSNKRSDKAQETKFMLDEINRLKNLCHTGDKSCAELSKRWSFYESSWKADANNVLKDQKRLHGHAVVLNQLQEDINKHFSISSTKVVGLPLAAVKR